MKDIVVAIDFSKGSIHALEYAVELANIVSANVHMVWVDNANLSEVGGAANEAKDIRNEAKSNLDELVEKYGKKLKDGKLLARIRKGMVYMEMSTYVKQLESALLIVGAHGLSGFEDYWIGTNSYRIVSSAGCPVITVRTSYEIKKEIRCILLPLDHTHSSIQKMVWTAKIAKSAGADVNILAINSTGLKSLQKVVDTNRAKVEAYFDAQQIKYYSQSAQSENLVSVILNNASEMNVDLIVIMTEMENKSNSILLGQYAQQLINYSDIPILTIHPKDNFEKK